MLDVTIETTPAPVDLSMADLRAAVSKAPVETVAPPETPETPTESVEAKQETEPGTVETQQEPEEIEEELPEGVKKKIAQEAKRQARYEAEINRAISARKAKEDELKKLSGSEPAPTTEKPSDGRPVRPKPDAYGTWGEYLAADEKYSTAHEAWLQTETRKTVEQEFRAAQVTAENKRLWAEALKDNPELPTLAPKVVEASPTEFQQAVSGLDNWAGVTVHLGAHPEELAALVQQFEANPYRAIAELGKLEERLKPVSKQVTPDKKIAKLPEPLKPVAGSASATAPKVSQEALEGDMAILKREVGRVMGTR